MLPIDGTLTGTWARIDQGVMGRKGYSMLYRAQKDRPLPSKAV